MFFILHPTDISEPPDKNLEGLTFRSEFIMDNALMIAKKKQAALLSLQAHLLCLLGARRSRTLPV
jgi:hypothetical protein